MGLRGSKCKWVWGLWVKGLILEKWAKKFFEGTYES